MIDLHSHVLPGIDDGARDLQDSLAMCRMAAEDGCSAIVATPHLRHEQWWNGDRNLLEAKWLEVRAAAAEYLDVRLGGEIAVNSQSAGELDLLPDGDLCSLCGSRYLLLEFHHRGLGPDPLDLIHELAIGGWWPVIAHPERIRWLADDPRYLNALVDHGALVQVTAMSVTGECARWVRNATSRWLDEGMVHFVASDAHNTTVRPPGLSRAYRLLASTRGEELANKLLVENPRAVLENRPLGQVGRPSETDLPEDLEELGRQQFPRPSHPC